MQYGICNLSIVPVRAQAGHNFEMTNQLLYGDYFKILEARMAWSRIRIAFDTYEGWVHNSQFLKLDEADYGNLLNQIRTYSSDLIEYLTDDSNGLTAIPIGCVLNFREQLGQVYDGNTVCGKQPKSKIAETALVYLNAPFLWGGKTPFGIDCSGLVQMAYMLCGYPLFRDSHQQASQGEALSFIEESEAGDLAFFDDSEGNINHVGIIMNDNYILHVDGTVRIDRIDHSGIFNIDLKRHTHQLRVIKKII